LATVLAYFAADWFFVPPRFEFNWPHTNLDEFMALMAFLFSSLAIAYTSKIMREALQKSRQKQRDLEREIVERERAEKDLQQAQAQLRRYAGLLETASQNERPICRRRSGRGLLYIACMPHRSV
jgi:K+-sensing histidine kinase KdpD